MNVYGELRKNSIRLKIGAEEINIKIPPGFYSKVKGTESYQMFFDAVTNNKIKDFINRHRKRLGFFKIVEYMFFRNRVLLLVDRDVQALMTISLINAYATLALDGRVVYIIPKPAAFNDENLESVESIKENNLIGKSLNQNVLISKLQGNSVV